MKKVCTLFATCFVLLTSVMAQDDLLDDLKKEDSAVVKENITIATFKSTRVINMQSVEMTGVNNLQFMIIHHFGPMWDKDAGASNLARLLGLNAGFANTYMSFDYSPTRYMNLGLAFAGNSSLEGFAKFKLMRQQSGAKNYPVSIAWVSTMRYEANNAVPPPNGLEWNRMSYLHQLLVARKFSESFSLQFVGSMLHNNIISHGFGNDHNVYNAGIGGRMKLTNKTAITFEYSRQLNMFKNIIDKSGEIVDYSPNLVSLGYDWDTGGHIFQFFITNSSYASNLPQLSTNPKRDSFGQWSLGFNLNRSYSMKHSVKAQ